MARCRFAFRLVAALCASAAPVGAQTVSSSTSDAMDGAALSSINNGEVVYNGQIIGAQITGGEMNTISGGAQGSQTSVKAVTVQSIAPEEVSGGGTGSDGGASGSGGPGSMIVGTTSTTINHGNTSVSGSYVGAVVFGNRNGLAVSASGASTSYSIAQPGAGSSGSQ